MGLKNKILFIMKKIIYRSKSKICIIFFVNSTIVYLVGDINDSKTFL